MTPLLPSRKQSAPQSGRRLVDFPEATPDAACRALCRLLFMRGSTTVHQRCSSRGRILAFPNKQEQHIPKEERYIRNLWGAPAHAPSQNKSHEDLELDLELELDAGGSDATILKSRKPLMLQVLSAQIEGVYQKSTLLRFLLHMYRNPKYTPCLGT